jgi:hypothetical protein
MSEQREWKTPGAASSNLEFIRPSKLAAEEVTGVILEGTYLESTPNHYDETKNDFKFEKEDGSVVIINGAGNLGYRMRSVSPGDFCQITYQGKKEIESGKMKGKSAHSFEVMVG